MSKQSIPGTDALVYFWFAMILSLIGVLTTVANAYLLAQGQIGVNTWGLTPLGMVTVGCYLIALVFGIVVIHKVIAMLIYLVRSKR